MSRITVKGLFYLTLCLFGMLWFLEITIAINDAVNIDEVNVYCTGMGYQFELDATRRAWCYYPDQSRSDAIQFFQGKTGNEYVRPFPCVVEGDEVWTFQTCCKGLEPYARSNERTRCVNYSGLEKAANRVIFGRFEGIIFGVFVIALMATGILLLIYGRKR
ncbi:MAG: hypothetical protein KKF44_01035 [Nanoarchaeota archaeon]|nr:hypothetical protein [Nanoarchaeota archaeon]